jgi:oligosaccharyltransferase complex subunit alpha (ribophorin I)
LNGGRPVVILRAKNLVEDHDAKVTVSYKFNKTRMLVEPLMLVAAYLAFFLLCTLLAGGAVEEKKIESSEVKDKSE